MIPTGSYTAVVDKYRWGKTKAGKVKIDVRFCVVGGDNDGKLVYWNGYFSDKAAERTLSSLRYCGWAGNDLAALGELTKNVVIVVEHTEWKGKKYAKVCFINEPGDGSGDGGMKDQLSGDELRVFAATMSATISGMSVPQTTDSLAKIEDIDIPF